MARGLEVKLEVKNEKLSVFACYMALKQGVKIAAKPCTRCVSLSVAYWG